MSSSSSSASEEILVLYGSQTGNSEAAAQEIASSIPLKLTSCTAKCLHLDDFLELQHAQWTRLVIIVCSSYGVGQAPIGARKFREVCDAILERKNDNEHDSKMLKGISFALLGLGDSHYTTFFQNPTAIDAALTACGATRVGDLGKADASGTGEMEQYKVVDRWVEGIWEELAKVVASDRMEEDVLVKAKEGTWGLCLELFPEWKPKKNDNRGLVLAFGGVLLSILVYYFLGQGSR